MLVMCGPLLGLSSGVDEIQVYVSRSALVALLVAAIGVVPIYSPPVLPEEAVAKGYVIDIPD